MLGNPQGSRPRLCSYFLLRENMQLSDLDFGLDDFTSRCYFGLRSCIDLRIVILQMAIYRGGEN